MFPTLSFSKYHISQTWHFFYPVEIWYLRTFVIFQKTKSPLTVEGENEEFADSFEKRDTAITKVARPKD